MGCEGPGLPIHRSSGIHRRRKWEGVLHKELKKVFDWRMSRWEIGAIFLLVVVTALSFIVVAHYSGYTWPNIKNYITLNYM